MESPYQPSAAATGDGYLQLIERLAARGCHDIPPDHLRSAWEVLDDLLTDRVGSRVTLGMSSSELSEYSALLQHEEWDGSRGAAAQPWLRLHSPSYRTIVHREIAILTAEAADWFVRHYSTIDRQENTRDQAA